ncbi:MAG: pentapeptide repeat-containing protein, partial [Wolinella succinogenes]|uniref:pentapeptide repeat-containing protein n=1 Tax=Wolinella succinogenes TaxID=844 RepID=UPI0016AA4654
AGANLEGADLWGADLVGANLTGVNLTGVNLEGVILTEKDLIGVDIEAVAKDPQVERLQGEIKILEEGLRSKDSILKQYRNLQQEFKEKLEESLIESEVKKKLLDSFRSIEEEFNKNEEEKKRDEERKKAESDRTFKVIDEATQELSKTYTATRIKSGFFFCVGVVLIIAAVAFLIRFIDQANSFLGDSAKIKETLVLIDNQPINYLIWVMPKILALGISLILMRFGHTLFTLDRELSSDLEYINRISGALKGTSKINQHYNSMAEVKKVYEKIVEILIIKETPKSEKNAPRENVEKSPLWAEQLTSAIERLTKSTFKPS